MALLLAHERFSKIKQAFRKEQHQSENIQELLRKLLNDLKVLNGILPEQREHAAQIKNSSNEIAPEESDNSLSMGDEHLDTIPKTKSDKVIKSSVEDLVPIPSESEDTSESDSKCILPSCDDFSPINVFKEKSVTFSNPLFNLNDDFTSSDDESLSDEDVPEENVKIYSNPLFEFDDECISSDVNPLFHEDECFDPGGNFDEIDAFLDIDTSTDVKDGYHDSEGDIISLESLLTNETIPSLPPEVFLDHDTKTLNDESVIDDSKNMVKVFDLGIHDQIFSPTYDCLDFEDSRARGFVHHPLELLSLAYGNAIS
nr:hypothetical protein [Tanacetum cinerariifolium]